MKSECQQGHGGWEFWVDRGGTFTDIVALNPEGNISTAKLLSENPESYDDAALHGIRQFLGLEKHEPIPEHAINAVKMGTTVATNALLEKKGDRTLLAITSGFKDIIEVGHQARRDTFALNIVKPELVYDGVVEIHERLRSSGEVEKPLQSELARQALTDAFNQGFRSLAIVLMHAYKYPAHELALAQIARDIGFTQISTSHEVSPLAKIVPRAETTVVDAYLTPILRRYIDRIAHSLGDANQPGKLLFMQSSGGLTDAARFRGRDAILSGPAGGIVGAVHTAKLAGFDKVIGFDMGGTSTDVSHYAGEYERAYETEVAGVRMRVPMMYIHTVAAGGGSLLSYVDNRFRVGPESAGANPGPVCYRRGGKLAVTDINVCLGKIHADYFPAIFGPHQDQQLDRDAAVAAFNEIAMEVGDGRQAEEVAEGFLRIAIEHMAQAIKQISVSRGYDVSDYAMNCFGGAGGQHACLVAERLGINTIFLHPLSGVLSAYGMGLADIRTERQQVLELPLSPSSVSNCETLATQLAATNTRTLKEQGVAATDIHHTSAALVRYQGSDTTMRVALDNSAAMSAAFEAEHQQRFGFISADKEKIIETIIVESYGSGQGYSETASEEQAPGELIIETHRSMYTGGQWIDTPIYQIAKFEPGHTIAGPAIVVENTGTIVIEPGWQGAMTRYRHLVLTRQRNLNRGSKASGDNHPAPPAMDPVTLEIFNNLFMSVARQMGLILQNTSQSVNVKERLDFSCAIFDVNGNLVANAPHVPVHLGSMDASVKVVTQGNKTVNPGDVFIHNNPYNGGSHLPDITVVSPVFDDANEKVMFYVASRAHHEDVGGLAPGSMSPTATSIDHEGIMFDGERLVEGGVFLSEKIRRHFTEVEYPARNVEQNIADLMAQVAANKAGANELKKLVAQYGADTVHTYMQYIQDNAEEAVRRVIATLDGGEFEYPQDTGALIKVRVSIDKHKRCADIDFTGTSGQMGNNFNAPSAITHAAVLYVFRCLVEDDIPLNAGCLKPLNIVIPAASILNPQPPAAVVAGNVETSQAVTNALFAALGVLGSSQGTMNNLTFGNHRYQYYETICSGAPAGPGFNGAAAVHTHMTNTRLTDPEIMEQRYPVMLDAFTIDRQSGGRGKWNAGDGVHRCIRFLESMECSILSGHRASAPYGLQGGQPGRMGRNYLVRKHGEVEELPGCAQRAVNAGDTMCIQSPTGGGFGDPDSSTGDPKAH